MKIIILSFFILLICFNGNTNYAQWEADYRLTNNPAASITAYDNSWCVAANGSYVHVVWYDTRDGNPEIYYKRSTDAGLSWGPDTRLTNNSADSYKANIAVSGSLVHVVWYDARNTGYEVYYKRSSDNGQNWSSDTRLTNTPAGSSDVAVSASGLLVHVVWEEHITFDNREIYYLNSTDGGLTWGPLTRLTNALGDSQNPSVTSSGQDVHVIWDDGGFYVNVFYLRSTDGGASWRPQMQLSNSPGGATFSSISCSGQNVHACWMDGRNGHIEVYYKRSTNAGVTWGTDTRLTNNTAVRQPPTIFSLDSSVHIVWYDKRDGNSEIYYKRSLNNGANWDSDLRLTNDTNLSNGPGVSASGSVVHVVWYDFRDGNYEIYYKRNPTGNPIAIVNINEEIPENYSLSQNYPNPFNPKTMINFTVPMAGMLKFTVFDITGKVMAEIINKNLDAGTYKLDFDGSELASGIYFYRIEAEDFVQTRKMILIK